MHYNIMSIILGLAAWVLALFTAGWKKHKIPALCPFASMTCCAAAILLQHYETSHLVDHDMGALLDTNGVVEGVATFLFVTTLALNAGAYLLGYFSGRKGLAGSGETPGDDT